MSISNEAVEAAHTREVIAVHEGVGEEAICAECYVYWPCAPMRGDRK